MAKSTITQVPVDDEGNWLSYDGGFYSRKANRFMYDLYTTDITFRAHMEIDGMYTGRSAKGLTVRDLYTGKEYNMFVSDFIKTVKHVTIQNGVYHPMLWTASKRGSNYGIKPVVA